MAKKDLTYQGVESKTILAVALDDASAMLGVIFKSGAEYRYRGVPAEVHAALLEESDRVRRRVFGASVGSLFARVVREKYPHERVNLARPNEPPSISLPTGMPEGTEFHLRGPATIILPEDPRARHEEFYDAAADLLSGEKTS